MRKVLQAFFALILGFLLLYPLAAFYGAAHLPVYHGWAMAHGSFTTAFPAMVAVAYFLLGYIPWFGKAVDSGRRIISSLLIFPLVTVLFLVEQATNYSTWTSYHSTIYAACVALMTALCFRAERPMLIPLFLLFPVVFDLHFDILMSIGSPNDSVWGDIKKRLLPLLLACLMAVGIARIATAGRRKSAGQDID